MSKRRIVYSLLAIVFGMAVIIFGGIDDSPGGQAIGFLLIVITVIGLIRNRNKTI